MTPILNPHVVIFLAPYFSFFFVCRFSSPPPSSSSFNFCPTEGIYTGRFIMFSVITNIYNKKTKAATLMELFTSTRKLKKSFFWDN